MARTIGRLSARTAETLKKPGRHADGGNLYLAITPDGARRWTFMYRYGGKTREMGLGSAAKGMVSLTTARELAQAARDLLREGKDPLAEKRASPKSRGKTFGQCADEYITAMRSSWTNAVHAHQWEYTLTQLAAPLRGKPVDQIQTADVLEVLKPVWARTPETASRLRARMESVLDAAKAANLRQGENPARWRGHLDKLLPKRPKNGKRHHPALPYDQVSGCISKLGANGSMSALALEFCILTACRAGEVTGAQWTEIDIDKGIWTIPGSRMKAGREHRVPLAPRALEILEALAKLKAGPFVFPGRDPAKPLSPLFLLRCLRKIGYSDITVHGFRSSFRDWAAEATPFPHEVCEQALAHTVGSAVERAYRRTDLFERRRELMTAWAAFCEPVRPSTVLALVHSAKP